MNHSIENRLAYLFYYSIILIFQLSNIGLYRACIIAFISICDGCFGCYLSPMIINDGSALHPGPSFFFPSFRIFMGLSNAWCRFIISGHLTLSLVYF